MEGEIELGFASRLLLAPKIFILYLAIIFYPVDLHLFRTVVVPQTLFEWQVILGTILLGGLAILPYFFWSSRREISFGILWFLISMLPLLNLTLLNAPMMEHWLYLPLIGLALAFVGAVRSLAEQVGGTRAAALGLSFLALLLSVKTVARNAEWGDLVKVFSHNVSAYPRDFLAWFWLGKTLREQGKVDDAIRAFKTGLNINPNFTRAWVDLGESLSLAGRDNDAELAFHRAISLKQDDPMIHHMLGVHQLKAGKNLAAIEALQTSLNLRPSAAVYHALGSVYLRLGNSKAAEQAFHKALTLYPHNLRFHAEIHIHLGKLYLGRGKRQEALEEWRLGLRFEPNHAEARSLLNNTQRNKN
jgi:tetratricopeptide (TPR) repeat protein